LSGDRRDCDYQRMAHTALLVMDVQSAIVARFEEASEALLGALARATTAARAVGIPVIYVTIDLRPGFPDISRRNRQFSAIADSGRFQADDPGTDLHPAVSPHPGDIVVTKKRVSAFVGSDLDVVLRSLDVDSLILTGIATSGVVLSTLRQAADLDYDLTVLRDGCMDSDPEVHRVLIEKLFPRQAEVLSTDEWVEGLPRTSPA
jgi:nicotinamidase-related amidase